MKWKLVFQIIKHCKCLIADEYVWKHVFVLNLFASIVDVELYAYFHTIYDGFFLYIYWMVFWMSRFSMQLQIAYTDLKKRKKWMAIRTSRPHVWIMCLSCYWCLLFRHKHNFVQQYLRSGLDGDRRARPPRNTHSQLTLSRVCDCVPVGIIIWHN